MSVETVEGQAPGEGGEVGYRRMGSGGVPSVLVHRGLGFPCDTLFEAFEPLASRREVIWYDQVDVGRSDAVVDPALVTVERFIDELGQVISGLGLVKPHMHGHSWGGMRGLQCAAERNGLAESRTQTP